MDVKNHILISTKRQKQKAVGCIAALIATILIITFGFCRIIEADDEDFPFHPGERLVFQAKWGPIRAGEAVLEILPVETVNGIRTYHFVMTAKTYPFIDVFYKVRDRMDSYADAEMTHALLYKKRKRGRKKKDVVVNFDWDKQLAQYCRPHRKRRPISILPGSFDPLSVFYAFRLHDLKENLEIETPVTDGKKCVMGKARVIRREKITVPAGSFDTYLVEPDLEHIGGVFEKSRNARLQIWVTADKRRIPVLVKSEVAVGSFVAELVSAEGVGEHGARSRLPGNGEPPRQTHARSISAIPSQIWPLFYLSGWDQFSMPWRLLRTGFFCPCFPRQQNFSSSFCP